MKSSGERLDNGTIELHALNVEQADATAVITEGGEIILTDADKKAVNEQLETVLADRTVERTENGERDDSTHLCDDPPPSGSRERSIIFG